jgi:hypothetical protein
VPWQAKLDIWFWRAGVDFCFFRSPLFIEWPDRMVSDQQHVMCEWIFYIGLPRFMTRFLTIMIGMTAPIQLTTSLIYELECVIASHDGKPSFAQHERDSRRTRGMRVLQSARRHERAAADGRRRKAAGAEDVGHDQAFRDGRTCQQSLQHDRTDVRRKCERRECNATVACQAARPNRNSVWIIVIADSGLPTLTVDNIVDNQQ